MAKYIRGHEVLRLLDIEGFELVGLAREGKLNPFTGQGWPICDIRIKQEFEKHDDCVLWFKKAKLAAYAAGPSIGSSGHGFHARKSFLQSEIARLEAKGAVPLTVDEILPQKYKDCIWEGFTLSKSEKYAEKTIQRFKSYLYLRTEVEEFKANQFPNVIEKVEPIGPGKNETEDASCDNKEKKAPIEEIIKKIEVSYENDYEFRIKFPGKHYKPCTWAELGCKNNKANAFKYLLEVIKEGIFYSSERKHQRAFERGCEKLTKYICACCNSSIPGNFKIYEKTDSKTYKLILKVKKADHVENRFEKMPLEKLSSLLKEAIEESIPHGLKDYEEWEKRKRDKINDIVYALKEKGMSEVELTDIIEPELFKKSYDHETRERTTDSIAREFIFNQSDPEDSR